MSVSTKPDPGYVPIKNRSTSHTRSGRRSDSDASAETASLSADGGGSGGGRRLMAPIHAPVSLSQSSSRSPRMDRTNEQPIPRGKKNRRRGSEWEVLEGLKGGQRFDLKPDVFNGYLHKKRKWPLKGWHKRYFVLECGILVYARTPRDISRGRLHGSVDVGLSVVSAEHSQRRIDIDAEEFIYHLKAKTPEAFRAWVSMLRTHRLYRQHLLTFGMRDSGKLDGIASENDTRAGFVSGTPGGTLSSWVIEEGSPLESVARELSAAQASVRQLQTMLDTLELHYHRLQQHNHDTDASVEGVSPSVRKDKRKFGLRKKKSSSRTSMDLMLPVSTNDAGLLSTSCGAAPPSPQSSITSACSAMRPQSLPASSGDGVGAGPTSITSLTPDRQLREDFTILAKDVTQMLTQALGVLVCEQERLVGVGNGSTAGSVGATGTGSEGAGASQVNSGSRRGAGGTLIAGLRAHLDTALHQNSELRNRLSRIHDASDLAEISSAGPISDGGFRQLQPSISYSSSCVSASEFFDAEEVPLSVSSHSLLQAMQKCDVLEVVNDEGDTSSEAGSLSTNDGSASSDNSSPPRQRTPPQNNNGHEHLGMLRSDKHGMDEVFQIENVNGNMVQSTVDKQPPVWRRKRLPAPRPDNAGPSLWNLLYKNIGKDLSQISMPVNINEPLNMLQKLCEDLEYSELLDKAAQTKDSLERLYLVAAFAVSAYGSAAHRAASKPFNPLLGETYECVREDKAFRFIAEQVSHHPPVSVCEADGCNWKFWQDVRIKTKFWGKSMEFQPAGRVNLYLENFDEQYTWNKVTTCVHNLFAGQRWVDQYGELVITSNSSQVQCKLNFVKSSYWSAKRHEVNGWASDGDRRVRLWGKWSEGLHCGDGPTARTLWMPNPMPADYSLYYGFSKFAMELNELMTGEEQQLPPTDTRLRPDQRALERGDLRMAEIYKINLEQEQRDRKSNSPTHTPKWFTKTPDKDNPDGVWRSNNRYWQLRQGSGFGSEHFPKLW